MAGLNAHSPPPLNPRIAMKTGLVLVDIQNDYFPGGKMPLVEIERAADNAAKLLSHFRSTRQPTFHIQHTWEDPSAPFFVDGSEGARIHKSIAAGPNETLIVKHFPNSFRETRLFEELQKAGVERLAICGAMSHMCIDATTRAAADLGFDCLVAHDACATTNVEFNGQQVPAAEVHAAFMSALGFAYARVLPTTATIAECK
jgi:nicotinamidase-related amidase